MRVNNTSKFIIKSNIKHLYKYDYSKSNYIDRYTKVLIICPIHGEFLQTPHYHLEGKGCKKCGKEKMALKSTTRCKETFAERSNIIHKNLYNYSKTNYINMKTNVIIICKIHGEFQQSPSNHLAGKGCLLCKKKRGWSTTDYIKITNNKLCTLYVIKGFNSTEEFIKIGMTMHNLRKRFGSFPYNYEIISELRFYPELLIEVERIFHYTYKKYKYIPKIKFGGYTECFSMDILEDVKLRCDYGNKI